MAESETANCAVCGNPFDVDEMEDHEDGLVCQGCFQDMEDEDDEDEDEE